VIKRLKLQFQGLYNGNITKKSMEAIPDSQQHNILIVFLLKAVHFAVNTEFLSLTQG
jgi:hypothetical protein